MKDGDIVSHRIQVTFTDERQERLRTESRRLGIHRWTRDVGPFPMFPGLESPY